MTTNNVESFCPSSSIAGDVWHGEARVPAYEWWYFDALSQDGRDALVVIFLSNFVFSPRYNRAAMESRQQSSQTNDAQFPALAFCFYRDGRPLFRAINEYEAKDFRSSTARPECYIGGNSFRLIETGSELLYEVHIETTLRRKRRLQARLRWTLKEGNFFEEEKAGLMDEHAHHWNMVAPSCDVSGEIALINNDGGRSFVQEFKGTGYHDHNRDGRWMPATIAEWQWGRIHFPSATAVFYRYRERRQSQPITRLYLIEDNSLSQSTPQLTTTRTRQHHFGLRYPQHLQLQSATTTGSDILLRVRQKRVIDGSFFYLRFLSEATLATADNRTQHASGITEQLSPQALSHTWLWWLINMRIGHKGRTAFLP